MNNYQSEIDQAERAFEEGNFDLLRKILPPLLENNIAEAIRINSSFFDEDIPEEERNRIYVEGMVKASKLGDMKAKYQIGVFYDTGEYGFPIDKEKASHIFKELSDRGDSHCKWIYACELIWGEGVYAQDKEEGIRLLYEASESGSANACMTIAQFHNEGTFGHEKDMEKRDKYRALAIKYDDTMYDPYA